VAEGVRGGSGSGGCQNIGRERERWLGTSERWG
jgi:hypothetical protein